MTALDSFKYVFLGTALALCLVAGVGVFWNKAAALASIPAGLMVISANFERLASLKVSSSTIEATMRDLNTTVDQAKVILAQLRSLAVITAESLIDLRLHSNAIVASSPSRDEFVEQDAFKSRVIQSLQPLGLSQDQMTQVRRSDRNVVLEFYAYAAYRFGRDALPETHWGDFDQAYQGAARHSVIAGAVPSAFR